MYLTLVILMIVGLVVGTVISSVLFIGWNTFSRNSHTLSWAWAHLIYTLIYVTVIVDAAFGGHFFLEVLLFNALIGPLPLLFFHIAVRQRQKKAVPQRERSIWFILITINAAIYIAMYFGVTRFDTPLITGYQLVQHGTATVSLWLVRTAVADRHDKERLAEKTFEVLITASLAIIGLEFFIGFMSVFGFTFGITQAAFHTVLTFVGIALFILLGLFVIALLASDNLAARKAKIIQEVDKNSLLTDQLRKQEQVLLQSEKMRSLGGLLAGVAHELNNPLAIVVGTSQVLNLDDEMSPDNKEKAGRIETAALRCKAIIRSFLDVAKPEPLEYSNFDIGDCIGDAVELTTMVLKQDYIGLKISVSPDLPPIFGSPDQMTQLIINLVLNAKDAILEDKSIEKGNGEVWINCLVDDESELIQLEVHDNGPGLPESMRTEVFEAFFTTKEAGKGTGLGLSIAGNIVHSHQGTIQFIEPDHKGACVQIRLPYSHMPMDEQLSIVDDFARRERHTILIVDDDPDALETLSDILVLMGQTVFTALSVFEGTKIFQQETIDFIITDIRMPAIDGKKFYKQIQKHRPEFIRKTAFVTGSSIDEDTKEFLKQTGRSVIEKPFSARDVGKVLDKLISGTHKVNEP